MIYYVFRRLLLLPITLFCIILVNFAIINLAPGDPWMASSMDKADTSRKAGQEAPSQEEEQYLQFREYYGLTLPILFNTWPSLTPTYVQERIQELATKRYYAQRDKEIPVKTLNEMKILLGDQARFIMPYLLDIALDQQKSLKERQLALRFCVRGGTRQAFLGPNLTQEQKQANRKIAQNNFFLHTCLPRPQDTLEQLEAKARALADWYMTDPFDNPLTMTWPARVSIFLQETRFYRYMGRIATLDFGTLRNDANKTVISEVSKRFKYSLTLSIVPMLLTFVACQFLGFIMAIRHNRPMDLGLTFFCLVLYATPVFVVAPLLIEGIALHGHLPFSHAPIPYSGFNSPEPIFSQMISSQRLYDIMTHIALPLIAIIYGSLAVQSRISRTAVLEVLRQDFVRTAKAKGLAPFTILWKHVGRNAGITIVTSIAGSLGILLAGSLIVETIFEIDGFGRFFYSAAVNRDYNVIMFSSLAGAFLSLLGYLVADVTYTLLDPRVSLE